MPYSEDLVKTQQVMQEVCDQIKSELNSVVDGPKVLGVKRTKRSQGLHF